MISYVIFCETQLLHDRVIISQNQNRHYTLAALIQSGTYLGGKHNNKTATYVHVVNGIQKVKNPSMTYVQYVDKNVR